MAVLAEPKTLWIDVDHFELTSEANEEDRVFGNVVFDYAPREAPGGEMDDGNVGRNLAFWIQRSILGSRLTRLSG